jgi:outer membrane usher protein
MGGAQNAAGKRHAPGIFNWPLRLSIVAAAVGFAVPACRAIAASAKPTQGDTSVSDNALDNTKPQPTYNFDSRLLLGSSVGVANIERFNKASAVEPGSYQVDTYVNGIFFSRRSIDFRSAEGGTVEPCLSDELLTGMGALLPERGFDDDVQDAVMPESDSFTENNFAKEPTWHPVTLSAECVPLGERVPGASTSFDLPRLRLDISVPQAMMKRIPRGYVDPASLDPGHTMAYINYDSSYYTASSAGNRTESFYTGISAGVNVGLWRLREQSAFTYNSNTFGGRTAQWNNIRTYAERPLLSWRSKLLIGESFTNGNLFSSIGYTGVHIESDDRMLPDSLRGYAPIVNGVANTNARVVIMQNGNVIYQTTVAPGPFSITDLNPTSFQGDLTVEVFEANGQVSTFTVPFSAVPGSLRPGLSRYSFTAGQVRQIEGVHTPFADLTYERGLTNSLTANGGVRVSTDYQSALGGIVLATRVGALGLGAAWSNTLDAGGHRVNGWKTSILYSSTIAVTATTFSLAGYRFSTSGYREFSDALNARASSEQGETFTSATFQQRDQFVVNLNQNFGRLGTVSLSGSINSYYGNRSRDTQFQLSYSNHYKSISFNLSFVRQQTGFLSAQNVPVGETPLTPQQTSLVNAVMATVSIPLGSGPRSATVSAGVTNSTDQGTSYQASVSGIADSAQTLSYGLSASGDPQNGSRIYSGSLQKSLPDITVSANYSNGSGFWQAGANARGAAVAHAGGITLGPYLGDTFAVVEAKGAQGATLRNAQGARVNSAGYAIVPSLTPYRYNDVALDTKGINPNAELSGGQIQVAPYAGSSVLLKFATLTGRALLITTSEPGGKTLPLGADVMDETAAIIGIVGQGSQAYARVIADRGTLTVKWGDRDEDQCTIDYDLNGTDPKAPITLLEAPCKPVRAAVPAVAE